MSPAQNKQTEDNDFFIDEKRKEAIEKLIKNKSKKPTDQTDRIRK